MAFDGTEGGAIPLATASAMTAKYRRDFPNETLAHFFGKNIIHEVLEQDGCVGARIYYAIDEFGAKQLVMVGVDSDENDILGIVADMTFPCPNTCSTPNPLNS